MAGRRSKSTQLIRLEGKSHRTKAELEHREKAEKALYTGISFKESAAVKADPIAHREFLRLKKLYKNINYVDGLDEQLINRYCLLVSQENLLREANEFDKLDKTRNMMLRLEKELYLTPAGRMRAIPKTPPDESKEVDPMAALLASRRW